MMVCRMCLQKSECPLYIFAEDSAKFQIAPTIARHFWFEPSKDDPISTLICLCCWSKIEDFHLYYLSVEEAQRRLTEAPPIKEEVVAADFFKNEPGDDETVPSKTEKEETCDNAAGKFEFIGQDYDGGDGEDAAFENEDARDADYTNDLDDFDTSDDEPLETLKSEAKQNNTRGRQDSQSKSNEVSIKSEENEASSSVESKTQVIAKKRGRKRKSEATTPKKPPADSEQRKKTNEYDEEIARQTTLKCDLCTSEFKLFAEMQRHYRSVHKVKGYAVCCSTKFYNRSTFFNHMIKHVAPERLKCDKCDKIFSNKRALQNHTLIFHDPVDIKIFHCDQCPKRYAKQYQLNHHKKTHLEKNRTDFTCDECGKGYSNKHALKTHIRGIHENAYSRICDICAKVLPSKGLFIKHKLEHEGIVEPRVQCEECEKWLKNAYQLKLHMRKHTRPAVNQFACTECGKTAPTKNALRGHIRYVHKSGRQYKCTYCDKAFKRPLTLKEHMATHTGDILYSCQHCTKTFNSNANLHSHRKKVHPKEWEHARKIRGMPEELLKKTLMEAETNDIDDVGNEEESAVFLPL
ncbi:transcription factor grauzone-like isoform X3 [Hermetia illucens]|nr:transcription factor grauzone-like isoform X3 [Hermetia illucens]